jgi:hypothetical protein
LTSLSNDDSVSGSTKLECKVSAICELQRQSTVLTAGRGGGVGGRPRGALALRSYRRRGARATRQHDDGVPLKLRPPIGVCHAMNHLQGLVSVRETTRKVATSADFLRPSCVQVYVVAPSCDIKGE